MRASEGLLTTQDVAWVLGVAGSTVRKLVKAGEIPHKTTFGGHYRFRLEDVEAFQAKRESK